MGIFENELGILFTLCLSREGTSFFFFFTVGVVHTLLVT